MINQLSGVFDENHRLAAMELARRGAGRANFLFSEIDIIPDDVLLMIVASGCAAHIIDLQRRVQELEDKG